MASLPPTNDIAALDAVDEEALVVAAMVREEGGEPRFTKTVPQCNICRSEFRAVVEEWFCMGMRASEIVERLGPDCGFLPRSIENHFYSPNTGPHCTLNAAMRQYPIWKRAFDNGVDFHTYDEQMSRSALAVDLVVDKFMSDYINGRFDPDSKDFLKAISMMWEMEKARAGVAGDFDPQHIFIVIRVMMSHVQSLLMRYIPAESQDAMAYFERRLQGDPIIKDLIKQTEVADFEDDGFENEEPVPLQTAIIVDAVIVEDQPVDPANINWDEEEPWEE